ncbi:MAG: hypothetical protein H6721_20660 [Sandaracinus sp.]|nr:hypothetical protein [Sandaracinus sp.]MCB9634543.1 hypothetical protein [Sandaracinus sp.]
MRRTYLALLLAACTPSASVPTPVEAPPSEGAESVPVESVQPPEPAAEVPTPEWLEGCEPEPISAPTLPEPDRRRPAKIALLLPSTAPLDVPEVRARVAEALIARLRRFRHRNVLPWAEVLAAESLRDDRRVSEGADQCAAPPALVTVLRARHPNLETVSLQRFHQCDAATDGGEATCGDRLVLFFDRVTPPAAPLPLHAPLEGSDADAWLASVARLERMEFGMSGIVGIGLDTRFRAVGLADEDPWLRSPEVFRERRAAVLACSEGNARFDVEMDVRADGSVAEVRTDDACVREALMQTRFPCTTDGEPRTPRVTICTRALGPTPVVVEDTSEEATVETSTDAEAETSAPASGPS